MDGEDAKSLRGGRPRKLQGSTILKHLKDGMIRSEWARAVEKSGVGAFSTARNLINRLVEDGEVENREGKLFHTNATRLFIPAQ